MSSPNILKKQKIVIAEFLQPTVLNSKVITLQKSMKTLYLSHENTIDL
jgi:hypothetical protein